MLDLGDVLGKKVGRESICSRLARNFASILDEMGHSAVINHYRSSDNGLESIIFDLDIDIPQEPDYAFQSEERLAAVFKSSGDGPPFVLALREDFPDTPHQMLVSSGMPRVLCIDDRPWEHARQSYTAGECMDRIRNWFAAASRGELHDAGQPIEPLFLPILNPRNYGTRIILKDSPISDSGEKIYIAELYAEQSESIPVVRELTPLEEKRINHDNISTIWNVAQLTLPKESMKRITSAPATLSELEQLFEERGSNLAATLRPHYNRLLDRVGDRSILWDATFCIVVEFPVIHPKTQLVENRTNIVAFVPTCSTAYLGHRLGIGVQSQPHLFGPTHFNPLLPLNKGDANADGNSSGADLECIRLVTYYVSYTFDSNEAQKLAASTECNISHIVLLGNGALGSHLTNIFAREGVTKWTLVDNDCLLPHNLARHTGYRNNLSIYKSLVAEYGIRSILSDPDVTPFTSPIEKIFADDDFVQRVSDADVFVDASASVSASRFLNDAAFSQRRVSAFFTPTGSASVLMVEDGARRYNLRWLEACYAYALVNDTKLADRLSENPEQINYGGACRDVSTRLRNSTVSLLSGTIAHSLPEYLALDEASLVVWQLGLKGAITHQELSVLEPRTFSYGNWTIRIPEDLCSSLEGKRLSAEPYETGGVLAGILDLTASKIEVVSFQGPPPDSKHERRAFRRGRRDVEDWLAELDRRTLGLAGYVGEWHTHPGDVNSQASPTDQRQLEEMAGRLAFADHPAVMIIIGVDGIRVGVKSES